MAMLRLWLVVSAALHDVALARKGLPASDAGLMAPSSSLLQMSERAFEAKEANPVAAVVGLLKAMSETLVVEWEEDEKQQKDITCWCTNSKTKKTETLEASTARVSELETSIEGLTAQEAQLRNSIKDAEKQLAGNEQSLAEATQIRDDQKKKFDQYNMDTSTYTQNLLAGITVLREKIGLPALPQVSQFSHIVSHMSQPSLLQLDSERQGSTDQDLPSDADLANSLDDFMRHHGYATNSDDIAPELPRASQQLVLEQQSEKEEAIAAQETLRPSGFLQRRTGSEATVSKHASETEQRSTSAEDADGWSQGDKSAIQTGLSTALAFMQSHGQGRGINAPGSSGELIGMLKTMKETMDEDLKEATAKEKDQATEFDQLKMAKLEEIAEVQSILAVKRAEHAKVSEDISLSKAEKKQEVQLLKETRQALASAEKSCMQAEKSYRERQKARGLERQSIAEAMEVLSNQETSNAFSFLQTSEASGGAMDLITQRLTGQLSEEHSAELQAALASSTEADSFSKVKQTIDKMVQEMKKQQQADNRKQDRCKKELFENGRDAERAVRYQASQEVQATQIESDSNAIELKINATEKEKKELEIELQTASLHRTKEHAAFLRTTQDQEMTIQALNKAKAKLAVVYAKKDEALLQMQSAPILPFKQGRYEKNSMGGKVMALLQSLMDEAGALLDKAAAAENEAAAAYGELISQTKKNIEALDSELTARSVALSRAKKQLRRTMNNIKFSIKEQGDLGHQKNNLKSDCDFLLKNFEKMKRAREQEMEALKQAKFVLSGATIE
eukprot:TRINITY_DN12353_c0_g1_i1.p1 TRINITY_DN12353_c0_g1~~TRINITY_DN12353_c0_g1_i1.p1  ORF type:complete len:791 (-),score=236.53 TRINITY_DN12353_c0_g1_i1:39-2411(-)